MNVFNRLDELNVFRQPFLRIAIPALRAGNTAEEQTMLPSAAREDLRSQIKSDLRAFIRTEQSADDTEERVKGLSHRARTALYGDVA